MQRVFQGVLAVALALMAGAPAEAGNNANSPAGAGRGSHGGRTHARKVRKPERIRKRGPRHYHRRHGKRFRYGYYYSGRHHRHWTHRWYSNRYRCYFYWCPSLRCYYHWCASRTAYYPVSYINFSLPAGINDEDLVMDGIPADETEIPPVPEDE
jgi:hypothetical protein